MSTPRHSAPHPRTAATPRGTRNPFAEGIPDRRRTDPCAIVLFGASGDLVHRKLVPALYNLMREGHLPHSVTIVGVARRPWSQEEFRARLIGAVEKHSRHHSADDPVLERFASSIHYHRSEFADREGYRKLRDRLEELDARFGTAGNRLFYLASAPEHFPVIVRLLGETGLSGKLRGEGELERPWVRVVVEKPFGRDLASASVLNRDLLEVLDETQIYRIDHYLGKETVQNILAFRFANGIFEPLWNQKHIDHVQITAAEDLGVGTRGSYYDQAGALRDMVQNHMMQLLALVAMEPPVSTAADAVRDEKVKVLRALRPLGSEDVRRSTVRGQYTRGSILGEEVRGYREEERVPPESVTPTYAALRIHIDNWRWAGAPFLLRHGKRLPKRATEIAIQFRQAPLHLFEKSTTTRPRPNTLVLNIQPDEGISLCFDAKVPGPDIVIRPVKMDFRYGHSFGLTTPDAYERLLLDAVIGDSTLFTRRDEVEASWRFIESVLEVWEEDGDDGLHEYAAGTWGPGAAERLLAGTSGQWRRL